MKKTTLLGILSVMSGITYLYYKKKEDSNSPELQGIEVKINPQKLIDGALAMSNLEPQTKDGIKHIASNAIKKYYGIN
jgi:hypothetical protein